VALTYHDPSTVVLRKGDARLTMHLPWDLDDFCEVARVLADRGWDFDREAEEPPATTSARRPDGE
jgi:hypothetical protein